MMPCVTLSSQKGGCQPETAKVVFDMSFLYTTRTSKKDVPVFHTRISAVVDQFTRYWITMAQVSQHALITFAGRKLRTVRIRALFAQRRSCKRLKDELCWRYDLVLRIRGSPVTTVHRTHRKVKLVAVR